jgi:hypothetical protein
MDRYGTGAHHSPTALGLHAAELGAYLRQRIGHSARVRHLIEAIGGSDGPDAYRLEQNIEARIPRHSVSLKCGGA